jgi:hypothetical protein
MAIDATGARANILSTLNNNNKVKPSETSKAVAGKTQSRI